MQATQFGEETVQVGSQGPAVQKLQQLLNQKGSVVLNVDGIFGDRTELAVKAFQYVVFLKPDGIVGPQTWQTLQSSDPLALLPVLQQGSTGELVARVQQVLTFEAVLREYFNTEGYYFEAIDGDFGPKTEAAVKAFQGDTALLNQKLVADGIIGPQTWQKLSDLASLVIHIGL